MKRNLIAFLVVLMLVLVPSGGISAATTADVTVNATPAYISIAVNNATYSFGVIATSSVTNISTTHFVINNTSTVQTDQTISVTTTTWSGGVTWAHNETCEIGEDQAGMKASTDGSTWVIVDNAGSNYIAENQAADTDYSFGLSLHAPSSFTDGIVKEIVVRVSAAAG